MLTVKQIQTETSELDYDESSDELGAFVAPSNIEDVPVYAGYQFDNRCDVLYLSTDELLDRLAQAKGSDVYLIETDEGCYCGQVG